MINQPINLLSINPTIEIDNSIFAKSILETDENGMSIHVVNILPNVSYRPHIHPYDHYLVVLYGSGYAKLNNRSHKLVAGSLILIPKNVIHQVGANEDGMKILVISHDALELEDPRRMKFIK